MAPTFQNVFNTYASSADYLKALANMIESDENQALFSSSDGVSLVA